MRGFRPGRTAPAGPAPDTRSADLRTLKTLLGYLWPAGRSDLRIRVIVAAAFLVAAKLLNVWVPFLYKDVVDSLTRNPAWLPVAIIVCYGLVRVGAQVAGELRDFVFVKVASHAQREIALQTFRHLHALSLSFHLDRQTGGLSRVIERGTRGIQFFLSFMTFNVAPTLIEIVLVTGILTAVFGAEFALITTGTIVLYVFYTLTVTEWRLKYRRSMNASDNEANTRAIDSLLNYETVKYFNNEGHEESRYDVSLRKFESDSVKSQGSLSLLNMGQGLIIGAGLVAVMTLAARGVVRGQMTIGDVVLVNTYLIQLYLPLNFLGFVYREMKQSLIDMESMFRLLAESADITDAPDAIPLPDGPGTVEFRKVSFHYQSDRGILHNVSFRVEPGQKVAIVGQSGSGKSTLLRLLYRFYDPTSGSVLVNGRDIRSIQQRSLRSAIGVVPQDTVLFNDSLLYNISYGRPGASEQDIISAARSASIHDFIDSLPQGYATGVGERGLKLSGGEKQRVAIARTILKDPSILCFDEATSSLDSQTEKEIQKSLNRIARKRTTLVIAHRLSTITDADLILVMKKGRIAERGNHQELLRKKGLYKDMWDRQAKEK